MGTPDFAEKSLRALNETGLYEISVVTQPDRPKGRGYGIAESDVKKYAVHAGIPVFQPEKLRDMAFYAELCEIDPEIIVVAAYGKILPGYILGYPAHGCVNIHGSLLPEYRGAAPIQRAVIDGREKTGITIMKMDPGLDTGGILFTREVEILPEDDAGSLFDKMALTGAELICECMPLLLSDEVIPVKQDDSKATYAPKIEKSECSIDFSKPARDVFNLIRGLSPSPLAYFTRADGTQIKICRAVLPGRFYGGKAGTLMPAESGIDIVCGDGYAVTAVEIIPAGKRRMPASDHLRGHRIGDDGEAAR